MLTSPISVVWVWWLPTVVLTLVCVSLIALAVDVAVVEVTEIVAREDVEVCIDVVVVSEIAVNVNVSVTVVTPVKTVIVVVVSVTVVLVVVKDVIVGTGVRATCNVFWMVSSLAWVSVIPPSEESASFLDLSSLNSTP
jgi:hypothetical protein